jgi:hypothetical protein
MVALVAHRRHKQIFLLSRVSVVSVTVPLDRLLHELSTRSAIRHLCCYDKGDEDRSGGDDDCNHGVRTAVKNVAVVVAGGCGGGGSGGGGGGCGGGGGGNGGNIQSGVCV